MCTELRSELAKLKKHATMQRPERLAGEGSTLTVENA